MASCEGAASLLLLELGLARALPLDLAHTSFVIILRAISLVLFFRGQQRDQLHGGGNGRTQVRRSCLGSLRCFLALTLRGCCCWIRAMRIPYPTGFLSRSHFKHSEKVGGRNGSAGGPSCLAPLRFFLT